MSTIGFTFKNFTLLAIFLFESLIFAGAICNLNDQIVSNPGACTKAGCGFERLSGGSTRCTLSTGVKERVTYKGYELKVKCHGDACLFSDSFCGRVKRVKFINTGKHTKVERLITVLDAPANCRKGSEFIKEREVASIIGTEDYARFGGVVAPPGTFDTEAIVDIEFSDSTKCITLTAHRRIPEESDTINCGNSTKWAGRIELLDSHGSCRSSNTCLPPRIISPHGIRLTVSDESNYSTHSRQKKHSKGCSTVHIASQIPFRRHNPPIVETLCAT